MKIEKIGYLGISGRDDILTKELIDFQDKKVKITIETLAE
jgi:hypothetical protein